MNYEEQIAELEKQQDDIEDKILRIIELKESEKIDLREGDRVLILRTDATAEVVSCKAVAETFRGDRSVQIIVMCKTHSGKIHELQRREVEKL